MTATDATDLDRLRLVASAIAGKAVRLAPADPGDLAWTDGSTIFLDPGLSHRERIRSLSVQAALLGAGSLDRGMVTPLVRRPALTRRYLVIEGNRALAAARPLLPRAAVTLVDEELAGRSHSPASSMTLAAGREPVETPPFAFGTIRPRMLPRPVHADAAAAAAHHAPRTAPSELLRSLDDNEDDEVRGLDLSSPIGGGGAIGRLLKRLLGDARSSASGPPGADPPTHRTRANAGSTRAGARTTARAPEHLPNVESMMQESFTYPEWDVHRHRYRPRWCTVAELPAPAGRPVRTSPTDTTALRRALARLGMDVERRGRQLDGIDIDIDAAVDARVELMAGAAPDEGVYVDVRRCRRDLAVLVLLDVSGSAAEPSASGGTVHEHQRRTAGALTTALYDLGDRVALYAFRSQGRSSVQILPLKRFGAPLDVRVAQRLGGCVPGAYTRVGAAIRHSASVLEREAGMSRRLLVVLSDGFAYDHGYAGGYGEADAQRALAETRRRGTGCVCLSIGAPTDAEALRRVFGTAAHAGVPTLGDLPDVVGPLFQLALRSAEAQRRLSQRRTRTKERLGMEERAG